MYSQINCSENYREEDQRLSISVTAFATKWFRENSLPGEAHVRTGDHAPPQEPVGFEAEPKGSALI